MFIVTIPQNVTLTVVFMMQPAGQNSVHHVVTDFIQLVDGVDFNGVGFIPSFM
jgi:hypothetical protein